MEMSMNSHSSDQATDTPSEKIWHDVLKVIYIVYIPFICLSNFLVIAATFQTRALYSPHDCIIACLAVTDFFVGGLSIPIYLLYLFDGIPPSAEDRTLCKLYFLLRMLPQELSLFTMFSMCVNRFMALYYPVWYRGRVRNRHIIISMIIMYFVYMSSAALGYVILFQDDEESLQKVCSYDNVPEWYRDYVIPSVTGVIIVSCICLNISIMHIAKKHKMSRRQNRGKRNRVDVTVIVSFAFIILWMPSLLLSLLYITDLKDKDDTYIYARVCQVLRLTNSLINAPIYAISRKKYRDAYKRLVCHPFWKWAVDETMSVASSVRPTRWTMTSILKEESRPQDFIDNQNPTTAQFSESNTAPKRTIKSNDIIINNTKIKFLF